MVLKVLFCQRKEKPDKGLTVKMVNIDELKRDGFKNEFEVRVKGGETIESLTHVL